MRKIEIKMLEAIKNNKNWSGGNTQVKNRNYFMKLNNPSPADIQPYSAVYLHGHNIATIWHKSGDLEVETDTLKEYPSNTTISRLRALGANIEIKAGKLYLDGEFITER